jgi:hypothetical protein
MKNAITLYSDDTELKKLALKDSKSSDLLSNVIVYNKESSPMTFQMIQNSQEFRDKAHVIVDVTPDRFRRINVSDEKTAHKDIFYYSWLLCCNRKRSNPYVPSTKMFSSLRQLKEDDIERSIARLCGVS